MSMNITSPEWVTPSLIEALKEIYSVYFGFYKSNDLLNRLSSGPFIKSFLNRIKNADTDLRKIYLFGGHDGNLGHLVTALDIEEYLEYPNYGSAIIFESYKNSNDEVFVRVSISCSFLSLLLIVIKKLKELKRIQ